MHIRLREPLTPRYIHINSTTNRVHILMPLVSRTGVGLDITYKSFDALQEFFGISINPRQITILRELEHYQEALVWDIAVIPGRMKEIKEQKQERLIQINAYIDLIKTVQSHSSLKTLDRLDATYPKPLEELICEENTNLFSMVLSPRPENQDILLRSVRPVFSVNHDISDNHGNRVRKVSILQQSLFYTFIRAVIPSQNERARITAAVIEETGNDPPDFATIQYALGTKIKALFGLPLNTYQEKDGVQISIHNINKLMNRTILTKSEYVDALLDYCTPRIFDVLLVSPFDTIRPDEETKDKTAESLSIITQFFLAIVNIHCRVEKLSYDNFGRILDESKQLSCEIAKCVVSAKQRRENVEDRLFAFFNRNLIKFNLNRELNFRDMYHIKKKFAENYSTIKEIPYCELILFYDTKPGKFVSHQGAICTDICEFVAKIEKSFFVQSQCKYFAKMPRTFSPDNKSIDVGEIEVTINTLLELSNKQFEHLPNEVKKTCRAQPDFTSRRFLNWVAKETTDKTDVPQIKSDAEALLKSLIHEKRQELLKTRGQLTDSSGRTFYCTAFEQAYWAKNIPMCDMLISYMDAETKAEILYYIKNNDARGLGFQQNGEKHCMAHIDLTSLKSADLTRLREDLNQPAGTSCCSLM